MNLGQLLWGPRPEGVRRLLALVQGLSPTGSLARAMEPEVAGWTNESELLATLVEISDAHRINYVAAHSTKGTRLPKPLKVPRPHKRRRMPEPGETAAVLAQLGGTHVAGGEVG